MPQRTPWSHLEFVLLLATFLLLGMHFVRLQADPPVHFSLFSGSNTSGDFYTDEGWDSSGAISAALRGHWYVAGDFNLAVAQPMWSIILSPIFRVAGISAATARATQLVFFVGSVYFCFLLCRGYGTRLQALITAVLLSCNFLLFTFSRLAMLECVWVGIAMASLVICREGARRGSFVLVVFAGATLALAALAKTTAVTAAAPAVVIIVVECRQRGSRTVDALRPLIAFGVALATVEFAFRWEIGYRFRTDLDYFNHLNLAGRIASSGGFVHRRASVLVHLRYSGTLLGLAVITLLLAMVWKRRSRLWQHPLAAVMLSWLATMLAAMLMVGYAPPRYFVAIVIPFATLAVIFTVEMRPVSRAFYRAIVFALILACAADISAMLRYFADLHYRVASAARGVRDRTGADVVSKPLVMGNFAYTFALFDQVVPVNDAEGPSDVQSRIRTFGPNYYLSLGPAGPDIREAFASEGRRLEVVEVFDGILDYQGNRKIFFYRVSSDSGTH